jgi:hypothetical protein
MLRSGARHYTHKPDTCNENASEKYPTVQRIHHALVATQFCDTVYDATTDSVYAKDKAPESTLPSISVPLGSNSLTIRFPEAARKGVCGSRLVEDAAKLVGGISLEDILHTAEQLCAWIIWLINEYLDNRGPHLKQHRTGRYLKFST